MKMTFNDIFIDNTRKGRKILKENYHSRGKIPIIDQGKNQISGFSDEKVGIYKEIPVIIFGDHTRIIKYVDCPFLLGADGVKILSVKTNKFITKYLYYALLNYYIPDTGYNRHFKWLKNFTVNVNSINEQKRIVITLDKIITMIDKKKKQINLLEELVKSRFIEMFGDPIKNEKGWEVKKLGKIAECFIGITYKPEEISENGILVLRSGNIKNSKLNFENKLKIDKKINEKYFVKRNDILMCSRNGSAHLVGKVALINQNYKEVTFGAFMTVIRGEYSNYLYNYFKSEYFRNSKILKKTTTINQITKKELENISITLPPLSLQNEFSQFVEKTDKLKFLYNLKLYIFINLLKKLIIEILFFLTFLTFSANIRLDIELAEREEKMKYHRRSIEQIISEYKEQFPILLLTGPRQVGKSTLFKELFREEYKYFSLDDPILKEQIINDPRLFLKNNSEKLIIDEIQYAPSIFPYLKMKVDENREDGMYLMTGSQAFVLMKNVSETLAGRVGILELQGISLREQFNIEFNKPFIPNEEYISEREKNITEYTNLWQRIHRGYMPELVFNDKKKWEFFYSSYVQTYIERDVRDLINISDESKFLKFMISLASRSGELLNYGAVANEVGVSNETVKRWVSVLRTSRIIYLMEPYFNNHLKRVIKTPKIYFMDVGLLAYLTKWPTPETLANGAKAGNIFETFIVSEIIKSYLNAGIINPPVYFYRDKDKKEIDLIIEEAEKIYPIEIKMSASPDKEMVKNFSVLKGKIDKEIGTGIIICQYDNKVYLSEDILVLPIEYI